MPRSLSKSQIDKLGKRLAKESPAREEDLTLLGALRAEYLPQLLEVVRRVREGVGVEPSYRLKTNATIIEKLRRDRTRLSSMQDIGGLRVVIDGSLDQQDRVVERIARLFQQVDVEDRRARPSAGYRAVHLIINYEDFPLEVQVRTELQDFWAQIFERLADRLGRGIRYGAPPVRPDAKLGRSTVQQIVEAMIRASTVVALFEDNTTQLMRLEADLVPLTRQQSTKGRYGALRLRREVEEMKRGQAEGESRLIAMIDAVAVQAAEIDE